MVQNNPDPSPDRSRDLASTTLSTSALIAALTALVTTGVTTLILNGYDITNPAALLDIRSSGARLEQLEQNVADLAARLERLEQTTADGELEALQVEMEQTLEALRAEQEQIRQQAIATDDRLGAVECDLVQHNLEAYGTQGYETGDYRVSPQTCSVPGN